MFKELCHWSHKKVLLNVHNMKFYSIQGTEKVLTARSKDACIRRKIKPSDLKRKTEKELIEILK